MFADPGNQISWVQDQLADLESRGELAIIMTHVPSDENCDRNIGKRLHAVYDRYQKTIRWIMYGHLHTNSFTVQTAMEDPTKNIGLSFEVGSVTPYTWINPGFSVLHLDPKTLLPVDYYVYAMNLTEAN